MTSEGLGEMFDGDSADMCAKNFLLMSTGGRAEGLGTPIDLIGNFVFVVASSSVR